MKTVNIWFHNYGEVSYTSMSPVREWHEGDPIEKYDTRLLSSDDFGLTTVKVSEVRQVELPDDLSIDGYCQEHFSFDRLWAHAGMKEMPIEWQWKLIAKVNIGPARTACVKLLTTNLKSSFRISLKEQLIKWLNNESKHAQPFSPNQWACLTRYER